MVHGQKQCIHIKETLLYVFPSVLHALALVLVIIRGNQENHGKSQECVAFPIRFYRFPLYSIVSPKEA